MRADDKRDAERARANMTERDIERALARPDSFALWSDADHAEHMFETWSLGPVIVTRDSGTLDRANAEALKRHLATMPEMARYWTITRCSHWAVGWVEHLSYQVVTRRGEPTLMAGVVKAWFDALSDYPVADESLLSEMESEDESEAWDSYGEHDFTCALASVFDAIDPEHDHDTDDLDGALARAKIERRYHSDVTWSSAFDAWHDGCDAFNVNGGGGCAHEDSGCHFYIREWCACAKREPSTNGERDMRERLLKLAIACRVAGSEVTT